MKYNAVLSKSDSVMHNSKGFHQFVFCTKWSVMEKKSLPSWRRGELGDGFRDENPTFFIISESFGSKCMTLHT